MKPTTDLEIITLDILSHQKQPRQMKSKQQTTFTLKMDSPQATISKERNFDNHPYHKQQQQEQELLQHDKNNGVTKKCKNCKSFSYPQHANKLYNGNLFLRNKILLTWRAFLVLDHCFI